ncbi:alpha-ketoglutarate-dependent dioxygenase AlkB family protein [Ferrimonas marina]|uniref:Alkylated DNA repair dioxygenase AlkB n=1 Tax=Ferrimonas marina TaxID=299255 RepID=A0A1M5YHF6_9GAMM|nr:alpha-ketoglutarate-dependent dioxygenase AlkB [Ferrimonas marina]SHI11455.1 Alkylated DNA repair dioxygenase AlkB [Ferrimonas marina]
MEKQRHSDFAAPVSPARDILDHSGRRLARYWPSWLAPQAQARLWDQLQALPWQQPQVKLFGQAHPIPRRQCYLARPGCHYRYSGLLLAPQPFPAALEPILTRLNALGQWGFNAALVNHYRDGRDRMGWHRDDEPELGPKPDLAILSLGQERVLRLRWQVGPSEGVALAPGSLLWLEPGVWHGLNPSARASQARISLTFRRVIPGFHPDREQGITGAD